MSKFGEFRRAWWQLLAKVGTGKESLNLLLYSKTITAVQWLAAIMGTKSYNAVISLRSILPINSSQDPT